MKEMKRKRVRFLILSGTLLALFFCLSLSSAALPDFNRLKILSISHALKQGPQIDPDPFYPEYLSLFYQIRLEIKIERPPGWDFSLLELPDEVVSHIGRTVLDLYQRDGRKREDLSSLRVRCEIHPIWVTTKEEVTEDPSQISYYIPAHLLEKGARGQIGPKEMLERGRAHLRALMRQKGGSR
ncbi:MAG: hypothetical protein V1878_05105 [bacterium]